MLDIDEATVARTMQDMIAARGDRTVCPTEVARSAAGTPDWHRLMPLIRQVAVRLALEGRLVITRKGKPVDPGDFKGVYRLGPPRND